MLILLLFFCSGATALIYEVLWSKYLTLLFGSTVEAQTVVLAIFMGGLALGNRLFGTRADRLTRPLAMYGYLEAALGLYAFFFSTSYKAADWLFAAVGASLVDKAGLLLLLKGIVSATLLLLPTILMGGTLPLLAAWLQKETPDASRRAARFYSTNSLGAVCGAGLAGFFLVIWLGLPATLQMTGLVNVLVGLTAVLIARHRSASPRPTMKLEQPKTPWPGEQPASPELFRWACLLVSLTGAVSMGLEVLASRCLGMIFGASLQAFAIVLMAFILGIGLGSAVIASRRGNRWSRQVTTIVLVLTAAAWIGLVVLNIESLATLYLHARGGLASSSMGYRYNQVIAALFSMFMLGLPAAALGAVLPLWIRIVGETSDLLGDRVGRLLTWNTLGAVGGVLLTGFVLMPKIGLRASFAALALVLAGVALLIACAARRRGPVFAAACVCGLLVLVAATGGANWRMVLNSGVFRFRGGEASAETLKGWFKQGRILFYEDAADATVSVEEDLRAHFLALRVNGKPDASTRGDLSTQLLCAHLPLMVKPGSKDVFVLGLGSGVTAGAVLGYPVETLTVAENCEPIVRAARFFEPWNNGVLTNARTRLCHDDGRTVLKLNLKRYDIIISEPSNPWTIGIGSVFSREFYQLAASRLKPGGLMAQWFHVYEMSDGIVGLVARTFGSVFPVMEIWDASDGDILMLGAQQPWTSGPEIFAEAFKLAQPRKDLARIGLPTPQAVMTRQLASQRTAFAVAGPGPIQTDEFPVLEYAAPEAFFIGQTARLLCRFDERTWQADIAPPEKTRLLASLGWNTVNTALGGVYRSVNADLRGFVTSHLDTPPGWVFDRLAGGFMPPCVFEGNQEVVLRLPLITATNAAAKELFEAERALRSEAPGRLKALEQIEQILVTQSEANRAGWDPEYYACLAAKARLRLGEPAKARQDLLDGLKLAPQSEQLAFLARILAREGISEPRETSVALVRRHG